MGEANLTNLGTVVGKTYSSSLPSGTNITFEHNVFGGNETWLVKSLILANNASNNTDVEASVWVNNRVNGVIYIMYKTWVPYGTTLVVLDESTPIYLQNLHYITVNSHQGDGLNFTIKYETLRE